MTDWLAFFIPWEFSLLVQISVWGSLWLYFRGLRRCRQKKPHAGSVSAFVIGVLLMYLVTQTHFEYWAQYMFFVHRGQHLVLHHLAPFLIALSAPASVLAAGLPDGIKAWFAQQRRLLQQWCVQYLHFFAASGGGLSAVRRPDLLLADAGNSF